MTITLKPPPDRLYGRTRGHRLRGRQEELLEELLPLMRWPERDFGIVPRQVWLEIGAGGFEHAEAIAFENPDVGLIACEVFANGIASLLSRLAPLGGVVSIPSNLRVYDGDARHLIGDLPAGSVAKLFLMFPDPWPKARHAKRRFVHPAMLERIARVLTIGGEVRIASDDPTYQAWVEQVFTDTSRFELLDHRQTRPSHWPTTRYEAKAIRAGRLPHYWSFAAK